MWMHRESGPQESIKKNIGRQKSRENQNFTVNGMNTFRNPNRKCSF